MSSNVPMDPAGGAPPEQAAPVAAEQPAAQPFTTAPGGMPPAPPTGIDPNAAVTFYQSFADPAHRDSAVEQTLRSYGYIPEGVNAQQLRELAQFASQLPQDVPLQELAAYAQEYAAWQQDPFASGQQQVEQPEMGQQQMQQQFDPDRLKGWLDTQVEQRVAQAMQQQSAQYQRAEFEQALGAAHQQAVAGMTGPQQELFEAAVLGHANRLMGSGQPLSGMQAQELVNHVRQQFAAFAPVAGAQDMALQQQVAPQTQMGHGAPQGGEPRAAGLEGSAQEAYAKLAQMGYDTSRRR
jgi:hypothetical protein